jgi:hypothetical protein
VSTSQRVGFETPNEDPDPEWLATNCTAIIAVADQEK